MGISEKKMQIVINNYFKQECSVNTSIREAFEKGFRIGVKKALSVKPEIIDRKDLVLVVRCKDCKHNNDCDIQFAAQAGDSFSCSYGKRKE